MSQPVINEVPPSSALGRRQSADQSGANKRDSKTSKTGHQRFIGLNPKKIKAFNSQRASHNSRLSSTSENYKVKVASEPKSRLLRLNKDGVYGKFNLTLEDPSLRSRLNR